MLGRALLSYLRRCDEGANMKNLKVIWEPEPGDDELFEHELTVLMERYGLVWWAQGFSPLTNERDVAYDKPRADKPEPLDIR
jgi:hypothetical protein